jgi:hypothetical protein
VRIPAHVSIAVNQVPVRVELRDGTVKWRGVRDFEHATLCRAFGLDQASFFFDLPSSVRGVGSSCAAHGGIRNGRIIDGYVMRAGMVEPWGKLTIIREGERIRDVDPTDTRELLRLG